MSNGLNLLIVIQDYNSDNISLICYN